MSEVPDVVGGDVITAAHMNTVKDRTVQRYTNAAARDAAVPTPQEGDLAFLGDVEEVTVYTGPLWETLFSATTGGTIDGPIIITDSLDVQGPTTVDGITSAGDVQFNNSGTMAGIAVASMSSIPGVSGTVYLSEVTADSTLGNATVLTVRRSAQRCFQIAVEKNGAAMFFRGIDADGPNWGSWSQVAEV